VFAFHEKRSAVELAFTDRFGGASTGPYAELNLTVPQSADRSGPGDEHLVHGESEDTVARNWDAVAEAMLRGGPPGGGGSVDVPPGAPPRVFSLRQVHGATVLVVGDAEPPDGTEGDGAVTAVPEVLLAVRAADCVPVLLADPDRSVVGAAHAGRRGVQDGVVPNTVAALRGLGAERLVAWIGPAVCGRCYEVPAAMREEVAAAVPETWSETSWGTPALDLVAGVRAQLRRLGVEEVVDLGECTIENADFYSHRRQGGVAGRHAGLIWVRP
jgi:YfiH family protein